MLIPIYGTAVEGQALMDESIPFEQRAQIAATMGVVSAIHSIAALEVFGHIPLGQVRIMQATVAYAPVAIMTATLAASTYAATKKGATVEHGPFGSVMITPKLGVF